MDQQRSEIEIIRDNLLDREQDTANELMEARSPFEAASTVAASESTTRLRELIEATPPENVPAWLLKLTKWFSTRTYRKTVSKAIKLGLGEHKDTDEWRGR